MLVCLSVLGKKDCLFRPVGGGGGAAGEGGGGEMKSLAGGCSC